MVPSTVVGLLLVIVAVLPGSLYTWAYERQASAFGVTLADRTLRFISVSVIFHLILAWPEYALYRLLLGRGGEPASGEFAVAWLGLVALVGIPMGMGTLLGGLYATRTHRNGWGWLRSHISADAENRLLRTLLGRAPAPRAWDNFFSERPTCYVRVKTGDKWAAGLFADRSYAAGFPHDTDLFLEEAWEISEDGVLGDHGLGYSVYVPAGTVELFEIVSPSVEEASDAEV